MKYNRLIGQYVKKYFACVLAAVIFMDGQAGRQRISGIPEGMMSMESELYMQTASMEMQRKNGKDLPMNF